LSEDLKTYQLIQDYLRGSLSPAEAADVESRAAQDTEFKQLLEEERALSSLVQATVANEVRSDVNEAFKAEKQKRNMVKAMIGTAAAILIFTGAALFFTDNTEVTTPSDETDSTAVNDENTSIETPSVTPEPIVRDTVIEHEGVETPVQIITHVNHEGDTTKTVTVSHETKDTIALEHHEIPIDTISASNNEEARATTTDEASTDIDPCKDLKADVSIDKEEPCLFGNTGFVDLNADGGTSPYIYRLNGKAKEDGFFEELNQGTYLIKITDANNCTLTEEKVTLKNKRCQELPIAFNPDQDEWTYETNGENVELKIMSRFGKEVFKTEGDSPYWDGRNNLGDEVKTYDYIFIISMDGQIIDKGNVTLVRS
jgi:gliding motility-associated-like protein